MHLMTNFAKNVRAIIFFVWKCIETSNFQFKFDSMLAFHIWYFKHYLYFTLCLKRVTYTKFWWNEMLSLTTSNYKKNDLFYLNFSKVMLKSVFELSYFTRKTFMTKKIFSKFPRANISYWVVLWIYHIWSALRHLNILSKKLISLL